VCDSVQVIERQGFGWWQGGAVEEGRGYLVEWSNCFGGAKLLRAWEKRQALSLNPLIRAGFFYADSPNYYLVGQHTNALTLLEHA
jgi:hypothetical protein